MDRLQVVQLSDVSECFIVAFAPGSCGYNADVRPTEHYETEEEALSAIGTSSEPNRCTLFRVERLPLDIVPAIPAVVKVKQR